MSKIKNIASRQIIDSRGLPTLETSVYLESGVSAKASVPSGASTGSHEALELRDNDPSHFLGKSVYKAVSNVRNVLRPLLNGKDVGDQAQIDKLMIECDGTENKSKIGANAILSVSLAVARAAAADKELPLFEYLSGLYSGKGNGHEVRPIFNVINGGLHAAKSVSFQEFFIIPDFGSFSENLKNACVTYQKLKGELKVRDKNTNIGDEGGFAPSFAKNSEVLELLTEITSNKSIRLGLDIASSTFYRRDFYIPEAKEIAAAEYIDFVVNISEKFNLEIIEDPLFEDDWSSWKNLTGKIGHKTKIIGDDLLVTNPLRLKKAIEEKACNGILIKLNQIGTLSETLNVVTLARDFGFTVIIS